MRLHTRSSDDAHRLSFVKRHLHELLRVVSSHPDAIQVKPYSNSTASPSSRTSKHASSSASLQAVTEVGAAALSSVEGSERGGGEGRGQRGGEEPDLSR